MALYAKSILCGESAFYALRRMRLKRVPPFNPIPRRAESRNVFTRQYGPYESKITQETQGARK